MKRLRSIALAGLAIFVAVAYIPVSPVSAQSTGSASLSIAPKKNYVVDPGGSVKDSLSIRNIDTSNSLQLNMRVIDFTYTDDSGTPKLMLDQNAEPTTWSLKPYLKIPEATTIKAGTSESFDLNVSIPKNLGAGSYYSAIIYSTGAPDGGNVGLSASGVTLVFVTVPGQVKEDLKLTKLGAYNVDVKKYQPITGTEPKTIGYTIENKGNVTEAPVGTIKLKNLLFGHENEVDEVNPNKSLALIGQTRTFTTCIKLENADQQGTATDTSTCASAGLWPGLYRVSADLFYGQNGNNTQELNKTAYFWYLPLWFMIVVLLLALVLAFAIWRLVVAIKSKTNAPRGRKSRMMRR